MSEPNQVRPVPRLDEVLESFEEAHARDGRADLAEYLPRPDYPDYLTILCELVRVDMEIRWHSARPGRLEEYEGRFPELFAEPGRARSVAFEEYRLRLQAGDSPSPTEYRRRFGGEGRDWPVPPSPLADFNPGEGRDSIAGTP